MINNELLTAAVRNNAEWCQSMCRAHGLAGAFGPRAWTSPRRTPLYYPDGVSLAADADAADVLAGVDRTAGASVKDSYARLDLAPEGFRPLFDATWIGRPAGPPAAPAAPWTRADTPEALSAWAHAWSGGDADEAALFRPALLDDPAVTVVTVPGPAGRILGGAVLSTGAGATGVSNLFAADGTDPAVVWAAALAAADPALPVVGYESGDDLAPALAAGFGELGPLRVWLAA
ncbi:hypothetical protein ACFFSH_02325 [Streptomyces filamentosus]|uniref:Uncharacterized protein n=1 Tax=Streptomyces filamentosus TaxID=67294 RepID=A0A919EP19_STRFL|nr:hypothetical protein [Streptomyces filamentosus]GHG01747.1 hypothetical protein GCM10017667_36690 [Streptomyces filamentosus]